MIATTRSDDIEEFLIFLALLVERDVVRNRAGATDEEIQQFSTLARLPLPRLYLGYLREFGANDVVVKMADDADPTLKRLIPFYREQEKAPEPEIPEHGVVIAVGGLTGQRALIYSEDAKRGEAEPYVVKAWWGDVYETAARDFTTHLYCQGFIQARRKHGVSGHVFKKDASLLPDASRLAVELGFTPYWFSDEWSVSLERDDGAVLCVARREGTTIVDGCFPNEQTRDSVLGSMVKKLGMERGDL